MRNHECMGENLLEREKKHFNFNQLEQLKEKQNKRKEGKIRKKNKIKNLLLDSSKNIDSKMRLIMALQQQCFKSNE